MGFKEGLTKKKLSLKEANENMTGFMITSLKMFLKPANKIKTVPGNFFLFFSFCSHPAVYSVPQSHGVFPLHRLPIQRQDHNSHSAAARGRQTAHDEGEVVERQRLSRGGEQRGQRSGGTEHRGDLHRAGCRTRAVGVCRCGGGPVQVEAERPAGKGTGDN